MNAARTAYPNLIGAGTNYLGHLKSSHYLYGIAFAIHYRSTEVSEMIGKTRHGNLSVTDFLKEAIRIGSQDEKTSGLETITQMAQELLEKIENPETERLEIAYG